MSAVFVIPTGGRNLKLGNLRFLSPVGMTKLPHFEPISGCSYKT